MLKDNEEVLLMEKAIEPGIRDPYRENHTYPRILRSFFNEVDFKKSRVLDLGPGHFEFLDIARDKGAVCEAIEYDPVVRKLGEKRGFKTYDQNLKDLDVGKLGIPYDGIFCRCSINAFWFHDDILQMENFVKNLIALGHSESWYWIAPCADPQKNLKPEEFRKTLELQENIYHDFGFQSWTIQNRAFGSWYGVHGKYGGLKIFTRNLQKPKFQKKDFRDLFIFLLYHISKIWKKVINTRYSQ